MCTDLMHRLDAPTFTPTCIFIKGMGLIYHHIIHKSESQSLVRELELMYIAFTRVGVDVYSITQTGGKLNGPDLIHN